MGAVAEEMLRGRFSDRNAQDVANTAWAFATLRLQRAALTHAISERLQHPGYPATLTAQAPPHPLEAETTKICVLIKGAQISRMLSQTMSPLETHYARCSVMC